MSSQEERTVPSWVRLLDSPISPGYDVTAQTPDSSVQNLDVDAPPTADSPDNTSPWYMSPFFDQPVIGYYNRITQSNLSLAPQHIQETGWTSGIPASTMQKSSQSEPPAHEQSLYSELNTPWSQDKDKREKSNQEQSFKFPPYLQYGASNLQSSQTNRGFRSSEDGGSVGSRDGPEVLKPEEYLSGLQTETYSIQYAHAPCGRCTRLVTIVLVLMGLAIVALATALTVSVLTKPETAASDVIIGGYPVVEAVMTLKILNKNFTEEMADVDSEVFQAVAAPYSAELDRLFLSSKLAGVYRGNNVTSLESGSIKVNTKLLFLDVGKVTNEEDVENVINSADRASQWKESDARAMGQFVVCADCVKTALSFTKVSQIPPALKKIDVKPEPQMPAEKTPTEDTVTALGEDTFENTTITAIPNIIFTNTTPFLSDGHFVISCDVTNASDWSVVTLEFKSDNSPSSNPLPVLVTLQRESPDKTLVADNLTSRVFAFTETSSDYVSVVVNVTAITCADRGDYFCRVKLTQGQEFSAAGRVEILEIPTAPVITEKSLSSAWDATPVFSCRAKLGYPPGAISLSAAKDNSAQFKRLAVSNVTLAKRCDGESEVSVSALNHGLLGKGAHLLCQVYSQHLQLIDSTKYSVFHRISLPHKLEITTKSTSVDGGLAAIRCRLLNPPPWTRLTLLKLTSQGQENVTSLFTNGTVEWTDYYLRHRTLMTSDVSASHVDFSIFIFSLKCADEGMYACALESEVGMTSPEAFLQVTAYPKKPELIVPVDVIENRDTPFPVTCKAKVGRPAGSLVLAVKNENEAEFRELNFNEQTTIPLSCTTEVHGILYPGKDMLRNGSSVTCSVKPHHSLHGGVEDYTAVSVLRVLPYSVCAGKQETNISHPTDCQHVISCRNDVIVSVHKCPDGSCFEERSKSCSKRTSFEPRRESRDSVCYPDKDHVTFPHPAQCTAFYLCYRGQEVTQHCDTGKLYVKDRLCSSDVTKTQCYKTMDTSEGMMTNSTVLSVE